MKNSDFLYLIWKDPNTRRNFTVGQLSRTKTGFTFEYYGNYADAKKCGWELMPAFPEYKVYEREDLFPVFLSRIPDKKRRDIDTVLKKYDLEEYDAYELLKKGGGRLPIDTYELVDPIFPEDKTIKREFYIAGCRHQCGCDGIDCEKMPKLNDLDNLLLQPEPTNPYDKNAVQILTENKELLGYVPRYYSFAVFDRLSRNMTYDCVVISQTSEENCQECIKVRLTMPKEDLLF